MTIIIGLGNPGEKFQHTRHNVGFMTVDFFAKKNNFPEFALAKKYHALVSRKEDVLLAKPQTFMNESGRAVKALLKNMKKCNVIVIHDDIDLVLGKIKIVKDRGSAGHKGVQSIIESVGNENMVRFRIGICPSSGKPKNQEHFVIKNFTKEEQATLQAAIEKSDQALDYFIKNGLQKTMNEYNG